MMKASKQLSGELKTKYKRAQHRLEYKRKMGERISKHNARLLNEGHDGFMFKPVTQAWSTIGGE